MGGTTATVLVTMNENKNVTANFSQTCYTLTTAVSPANSGTITPSSPPNCGSTQYTAGTVVTLSAAPAGSGYQFSNWSGDASGTIPTAPITMNGNRSVTANFSQVCYTVTTAVAPNNSGTVNRTPPPNCGVDRYMAGTTITFAAIPSTGYQFNNWSGSATGSASPVSLMVDGDKAVTANFSQACFT
ncbi:MAG: InlB B-repeat-containing protein [Chloroflexi bacterium]|nr:InlB B-repeat-containing protein [Chloroflexota bacterium]